MSRKRLVAVLILLLLANTSALVLVWEQPDCAGGMTCHEEKTVVEYLIEIIETVTMPLGK